MISHVGMDFRNKFADLFTFQLLEGKYAVASVDFVNDEIDRVLLTSKLTPRREAIIRLAKIIKKKVRNANTM